MANVGGWEASEERLSEGVRWDMKSRVREPRMNLCARKDCPATYIKMESKSTLSNKGGIRIRHTSIFKSLILSVRQDSSRREERSEVKVLGLRAGKNGFLYTKEHYFDLASAHAEKNHNTYPYTFCK